MTEISNIEKAASSLIDALSSLSPDDKLVAKNLVHQFFESNRMISHLPKPENTSALERRITELENTLKIVHFELSTMPEKMPGGYAVKVALSHINKVLP